MVTYTHRLNVSMCERRCVAFIGCVQCYGDKNKRTTYSVNVVDKHMVVFLSLYPRYICLFYVWLNLSSYRLRGHGHSENEDSVRDRHG